MTENIEQTECFDCSAISIRKLYNRLAQIALVMVIVGVTVLVGLSYWKPAYMPNFSIGFVLALYLVTGIMLGITLTMTKILGKNWLRLIKGMEKLHGENIEEQQE